MLNPTSYLSPLLYQTINFPFTKSAMLFPFAFLDIVERYKLTMDYVESCSDQSETVIEIYYKGYKKNFGTIVFDVLVEDDREIKIW